MATATAGFVSDPVLEHRTTTFLRNYQGEGTLFETPVDGARAFFIVAASNNDFARISLELVIDPANGEPLLPNIDEQEP